MDKDRQIRFLYPPLIFLSSIALGIWFDNSDVLRNAISNFIKESNNTNITIALLGAGSLVLVLGFLLGTLTVFILRFFFLGNRWSYEVKLSEKSYQEIGKIILKDENDSIKKKDRLYAGIIFDHGFIPKNVHQWIIRRWNAFFISSSSTLALLSSLVIGRLLNISISYNWLLVTVSLMIIFITQSCFSWKETMKMIEFMIRIKGSEKPNENNNLNNSQEE